MEIGWWGGHGSSDDEGENTQIDAEPGGRPGTPDAEDAPATPAAATPAAATPAPVTPAAAKPMAAKPRAVRPRPAAPEVDEPAGEPAEAEPLAKVSYLPWAAPGVDVTTESGMGSTAFRRPWVEPERELAERGFDASAPVALPRQLAEPGDWTEEYSDEADDEDEVEEFDPDALERALLKKLARRDMSIVEVEQFLEQNGLPAEQLEEWVERMVRLGYLDDLRLAENIIDQLRRRKGLGASSIKQELNRRRISPAVVSEALGESDQDEERARAMELAVKRAGQLSSYDDATAERRLTGFLMRKGYGSGVVRDAVKAALAARKRPTGGVRFR
ncbi:regulatory protein RecX [Microterricola viridarii]|uniref:Regulatory protein RecX n=1 Tax=Microterricola viridarii TaxID=412690 RepID=A0A1H1X0M5_9MICO|nr:regulatory protein RecX [Microterricola viridarii]SDT02651.1 regulatory protein [Microterricola viridarii]